jgi:hypothetical protein
MKIIHFILMAVLFGLSCSASAGSNNLAQTVITAFEQHWLVAIGENHRHKELHQEVLNALSHPKFDDDKILIVVEFGNQSYQKQVDDYVLGNVASKQAVKLALLNTVISPNRIWESPVYERFFEQVRDINITTGKTIRIILGDSEVDWSAVTNRQQLRPYYRRAEHMAEMIDKYGYQQGKKVLFLSGGLHTVKQNITRESQYGYKVAERSVISRIEHKYPDSTFVIRSVAKENLSGVIKAPDNLPYVLIDTHHHPIGKHSANQISGLKNRDGSPFKGFANWLIEDVADSIIYWPSEENRTFEYEPDDSQLSNEYLDKLDKRSQIVRNRPYR